MENDTHVASSADEALLLSLNTQGVLDAIQHAHANGKISLETYNALYQPAQVVARQARELADRLESEADRRDDERSRQEAMYNRPAHAIDQRIQAVLETLACDEG